MRMRTTCIGLGRGRLALLMILAVLGMLQQACTLAAPPFRDSGRVSIEGSADIKGDDKDVAAILAAFNHAEDALHLKNVDGVMALYSEQYRHHGLSKTDLRAIWEEMLAHYDGLASTHVFSRISVEASRKVPTARVSCTGSLWGTSKATKEREAIDSWFFEIHHLVYEDGEWRILGHEGGDTTTVTFGKSPHPFF
jgi:hypothetical protein